ncbi:MAG TPA: hypothetical protein PKL53_08225, partial [Methylotenera sp.]|nr:hypothetical protein [Methylotenera sp.]
LYLLLPSVLFTTPTLYFFLHITFLDGNNIWWGNIEYGYSGIYFSIIVSLMVFFGVYYTLHLLIVSFLCGKIMETEVSLRPFHEDGCNGLESLGLFILYLWGFAISLAAAIFVTLKFGYMGVEKQMYIWILSLMAVFCIPIIAIYPLYKSIVSAYTYRRNRLAKLEKRISTSIEKLDNNINKMTNKEFIEESDIYEKLMVLHKSIHEMNLWPFDVKVLISAIFVYILQALLIAKEVVSNINQL